MPSCFNEHEDREDGWAVRINGVISIRTASYRPEAAMVNALVLFGNYHVTDGWSDEMVRVAFVQLVSVHEGMAVVRVKLVEIAE